MKAPWEDDPLVGEDQPPQQAMGAGSPAPVAAPAPAPQQAPWQADPVADPATQAPATGQPAPDAPAQVETPQEGRFFDDPAYGHEASRRMSPEQEAELVRITATAPIDQAASLARQYAASQGWDLGDSIDKVVEHRRKYGKVADSFDYHLAKQTPQDGAVGSFGRGMVDAIPFGNDMGALADTLTAEVTGQAGQGGFGDEFDRRKDVIKGTVQADEEHHGTARLLGQLTAGLAIPVGSEGVAFTAGRDALRAGATIGEARAIAATAARNRMILNSGLYGAAHGAGEGNSVGGRVGGALAEGALGAVGGAVAGLIGEAVAPRLAARAIARRTAPLTDAQQVVQAAGRQGIDILPADAGGPVVRRATSATAQTIAGGQPIINAANRMTDQAQAVRDRVAGTLGRALRPEAAGQEAIRGARGYITRTSQEGRRLYAQAVTQAGDARVAPTEALRVLDQHINELSQTPGGSAGLDRLQGLRDALSQGNVTVAGMRNMRTALRDDFAESGLRGSDIERRVGQVVDAASDDVVNGLHAAGRPDAARSYQLADRYWRNRVRTIDQTIEPLIGKRDAPKSGEQVVKTLMADLQGNNGRAVRFLRTLAPGEAGDVRASVIGALGRSTKGTQNADGDAFSLATFLTNWNEVGDTAKNAYFGPEARAALNDLARVAQGAKEAQQYANRSNTGGAVGNLLTMMTTLGGAATFGKTIVSQYAMGRLLASPRFARWLARAPRTALSTPAYVERLGRIARAEPAIANDVLSLQSRLSQAFEQQPMRAAADPEDDKTPQ